MIDIFNTWKHELAHFAGFKSEAKADSLEACATRNPEREDTIWAEKRDTTRKPPPRPPGGPPDISGSTGWEMTIETVCGYCYFSRNVK